MISQFSKENGQHTPAITCSTPIIFKVGEQDDAQSTSILRLFMYVTEDALFDIIHMGRLKLSCPWRVKDVTECVIQDETRQSEFIKGFGYLCFTSNPKSPAMWGYYANRSRGACLAFDFEVHEIEHCAKSRTFEILDRGCRCSKLKIIREVQYRKNKLKLGPSRLEDDQLECFYIKSDEWKHEKEYRIIYELGESDDVECSKEENGRISIFYETGIIKNLSSIILGVRCPLQIAEVRAELRLSDEERCQPLSEGRTIHVTRTAFDEKNFSYKIPALKKCDRHPFFTYNQWNEIKKQSWRSESLPETVTFLGDFTSNQFCTEIFKCDSKRQESYYLLREYKGVRKRHLFRLYENHVLSPVLGIKNEALDDLYLHINQQILCRKVFPTISNPYLNL